MDRTTARQGCEETTSALVGACASSPAGSAKSNEFYKKNPQALASVRAPIFEEKVVDFVSELGQVKEKKVSRAEIERAEEEDSAKASA